MKSRLLSGAILLIFLLGLTVAGLTHPISISAQGTYRCFWAPYALPGEKCRNKPSCVAGYVSGSNCRGLTPQSVCEAAGPYPCIKPGAAETFTPDPCPCTYEDPSFCSKYPPIQTALGCVPTHPLMFVAHFREVLIGVGGGVAFLMMIIGAAFVLTSQGQPERIQRGKEVFVAGLVGLLVMIFSVVILQLIGVDILGLFL